jgi:predicted acyl esterase
MTWHAGQRLQLIISGSSLMPADPTEPGDNRNTGTHRIRTGGSFDSHLLLPITG